MCSVSLVVLVLVDLLLFPGGGSDPSSLAPHILNERRVKLCDFLSLQSQASGLVEELRSQK